MSEISVILKNDLAEIERLSQIVDAFGRSHHLPEDFLYGVNVALDEILTNVISYGYSGETVHEIAVRLAVHEDEFIAEITDDARPFNPLAAPPAEVEGPLSERQIGGLGIHLARTFMNEMEYRREHEKNILIMKKRIAV
jgi:anti-sigma regulatory factor (Ser/Thr protein kinase)